MRRLILPILILILAAGSYAYYYYYRPNVPATLSDEYLKIPTGSNMADLENLLVQGGFVTDIGHFKSWADNMKFKNVRPGRFKIKPKWSSRDLVKHLQRGEQAAVKVVLNNERTPNNIAGKIAKVLELDSATFAETFSNQAFLDSFGYKKETFMSIFIPNTYEFFWNTDPKKFVERMAKEHKRFWNDDRMAKAKALNLTPTEVSIMASIVDGETYQVEERPRVAGAYLNRLQRGIKLQADPTVQYALMEIEHLPSFRRLLNRDYNTPHPYNTYIIDGLPPGPIAIPSVAGIDAVLSPEKHNYIYFCAKPDNTNYHNYAETLEQHLVNVKKYTTWLNSRNN